MSEPRKINYAGGQTLDNSELVDEKIKNAVEPVTQDLAAEVTRAKGRENELTDDISDLSDVIATESDKRRDGDNELANKIGDLDNLDTSAKTNLVAAINEIKGSIPDAAIIDDHLDETSTHAVQNKAIVESINEAVEPLKDAIDELNEHLPLDDKPTEGSEKGVKSGGTWDAIQFASVKVGETMYWPVSDQETREVHSDNPFVFKFNGEDVSVTTQDGNVDTCISKDIPDGWHALDGRAELEAADYPELAAFIPDNVTNNGKIWLPYIRQHIIKVKY